MLCLYTTLLSFYEQDTWEIVRICSIISFTEEPFPDPIFIVWLCLLSKRYCNDNRWASAKSVTWMKSRIAVPSLVENFLPNISKQVRIFKAVCMRSGSKNRNPTNVRNQCRGEPFMFAIRTKTKNEPISKKQCIWIHGLPSPSDIGLISVSVRGRT